MGRIPEAISGLPRRRRALERRWKHSGLLQLIVPPLSALIKVAEPADSAVKHAAFTGPSAALVAEALTPVIHDKGDGGGRTVSWEDRPIWWRMPTAGPSTIGGSKLVRAAGRA